MGMSIRKNDQVIVRAGKDRGKKGRVLSVLPDKNRVVVEGVNLITMPMTTEQAVVPGRETYGEAKKIAQIELSKDGDRVRASVSRARRA